MLPEEQQRATKNKNNPINRLNDDKNPRKGPRLSIYWIYAIIAAILIGTQLFNTKKDAREIDEKTFKEEMYKTGDVDRTEEVVNKRLVRVFIKQESLNKPYYQSKLKNNGANGTAIAGPQFQFRVTDWQDYKTGLREFAKANNLT